MSDTLLTDVDLCLRYSACFTLGYELPETGDEAKVARSLRRAANAEYAQTPLAAVPIPIWREALAVERPALPQVSDAELAAPLAALLSRWPVATG